jgi:hypothetical protein
VGGGSPAPSKSRPLEVVRLWTPVWTSCILSASSPTPLNIIQKLKGWISSYKRRSLAQHDREASLPTLHKLQSPALRSTEVWRGYDGKLWKRTRAGWVIRCSYLRVETSYAVKNLISVPDS